MLVGFFADAHIYLNHIDGVKELLQRPTDKSLPTIETNNFNSIYEWEYNNTTLHNYNPYPSIKFQVAI